MKRLSEVTKEDKEKIEFMTNSGFGDVDIVDKLQIIPFAVGKITTQYWKDKMKNK